MGNNVINFKHKSLKLMGQKMSAFNKGQKVEITSDFFTGGREFKKGQEFYIHEHPIKGWVRITNVKREFAVMVPQGLIKLKGGL